MIYHFILNPIIWIFNMPLWVNFIQACSTAWIYIRPYECYSLLDNAGFEPLTEVDITRKSLSRVNKHSGGTHYVTPDTSGHNQWTIQHYIQGNRTLHSCNTDDCNNNEVFKVYISHKLSSSQALHSRYLKKWLTMCSWKA